MTGMLYTHTPVSLYNSIYFELFFFSPNAVLQALPPFPSSFNLSYHFNACDFAGVVTFFLRAALEA